MTSNPLPTSSASERRLTVDPVNPLNSRVLLGEQLRRLRQQHGMTIRQVADFLECSEARISRLETGKLSGADIKPNELGRLAAHLGVHDPQETSHLLRLLAEAQQTPWWKPYEETMPDGLAALVGTEGRAAVEQTLAMSCIPDLLQTDAYFRILLLETGLYSHHTIDRLADLRSERAKILCREPTPLALEVVLDEAALWRVVGGPQVMREQLATLAQTDLTCPDVTVFVIPFSRGAHAGLSSPSFSLFGFTDLQSPVACVEHAAGPVLLTKDREVERLTRTYEQARAKALGPDDSLDLIMQITKDRYH